MYIKKIRGTGFRNLSNLEFMPNNGLNVFIGKNGQGKTNFLETIYIASKGKSFRAGNYDAWKNQNLTDQDYCLLDFLISDDQINHQLRIKWNENQKELSLDGKKITTAKLVQLLPTILFSPESLLSIKEGPDKRRNLIDEMLLSSYEDQHYLQQYKKTLKNRNKFLKDCKDNQKFEENLYNSLNVLFLNFSTKLTQARINYLLNLETYIKKTLAIIFGSELEYRFEYLISDQNVKSWEAKEIHDLHTKRINEFKNAEYRVGTSLVGAHKHDIKFFINEKDSRFFCSQGQQRGLILALKMAEVLYRFKKGEKPILLLDDVLSELDQEKRERLLEFLKVFKTQIFITTTEIVDRDKMQGHFYNVEDGQIKKEKMVEL